MIPNRLVRLSGVLGVTSVFALTTGFTTASRGRRMDSTLSVSFSPATPTTPTAADYDAGATTGTRIVQATYTIDCGSNGGCTASITPTAPVSGPGTTSVRYATSAAGPFTSLTSATQFANVAKGTTTGTFFLQFTLSWTATKPGAYALPVRFDLNT
jgi:hypothetical protein